LTTEQKNNVEIIAISSDGLDDLQIMTDQVAAENEGLVIEYSLLSDSGGGVINRYGLLSQVGPNGRAIPHPTTYIVDKSGMIHWKMTEIDYRIRPENKDILMALDKLANV
jgi:peroxiredoxin